NAGRGLDEATPSQPCNVTGSVTGSVNQASTRMSSQPPTGATRRKAKTVKKLSLDAIGREQLAHAKDESSGRSSSTVFGGHEQVLRHTVIALREGASLTEHNSPGEATIIVLSGHVLLRRQHKLGGSQRRPAGHPAGAALPGGAQGHDRSAHHGHRALTHTGRPDHVGRPLTLPQPQAISTRWLRLLVLGRICPNP